MFHTQVSNEKLFVLALVIGHCCSVMCLCNESSIFANSGTDFWNCTMIVIVPEFQGHSVKKKKCSWELQFCSWKQEEITRE
jgi:hypothetical protein